MKQKLFTRVPSKLFTHLEEESATALEELSKSQNTQVLARPYYDGIIVLDEVPPFDYEEFNIYDEKDFKKYIDEIKKVCRASFEYRHFVNYLRDYMDMNKCSFFQNVSNKDTFKIKIELHHSPFALHDIVRTIFNKRQFYNENLEVEMVAKEVMYIHYFCMVGIIPLAETVHELVHNQIVFIPIDNVFGNYEEFIQVYKEFIPEDVMEKFETVSAQTLAYNEEANLQVLQQSPLIIQLPGDNGSGTYKLPKLEDVSNLMKQKILEIKNAPKSISQAA